MPIPNLNFELQPGMFANHFKDKGPKIFEMIYNHKNKEWEYVNCLKDGFDNWTDKVGKADEIDLSHRHELIDIVLLPNYDGDRSY